MKTLRALNLGCGDSVNPYNSFYNEELKCEVLVEWTRLDVREGSNIQADIVWDLNKVPLPFNNEEFDYVYCTAVLEHIKLTHVAKKLIPDIYRILKKGGIFEVMIPNLFLASREVYGGKIWEGLKRLYSADTWREPDEKEYYQEAQHLMCYTLGMMLDILTMAGLHIKSATNLYQDKESDVYIKALKL